MVLVLAYTNSYWLSGTPIMSQTIFNGSRAEMAVTASHSPWARASSTILDAVRCTSSVSAASRFGVKPRETMRRSRECRGSSRLIIDPKNSRNSGGRSVMLVAPAPEVKTFGVRLASTTSSKRVSAQ